MKIRDLGKAIMDFELNTVPNFLKFLIIGLLILAFKLLSSFIRLYKSAWPLLLLASLAIFFLGIDECIQSCDGINIKENLWLNLSEDSIILLILIPVSFIAAFVLDKKLTKLKKKFEIFA
jgi:hypothetical protein